MPMRMQEAPDLFRCKFVDGEIIGQTPRVERLFLSSRVRRIHLVTLIAALDSEEDLPDLATSSVTTAAITWLGGLTSTLGFERFYTLPEALKRLL